MIGIYYFSTLLMKMPLNLIFDIELDPGTHNGVQNKIISHNPLMIQISFPIKTCVKSDVSHTIHGLLAKTLYPSSSVAAIFHSGVIGSDVPWLECPACNALTWVITVTE